MGSWVRGAGARADERRSLVSRLRIANKFQTRRYLVAAGDERTLTIRMPEEWARGLANKWVRN